MTRCAVITELKRVRGADGSADRSAPMLRSVVAGRATDEPGEPERLGGVVEPGPRQQLERAGRAPGTAGSSTSGGRGVRGQVVDGGGHLRAGHTVDGGVVDLADEREGSRRNALDVVEALDDVELPQRTVEVELAGVQPRRLDAQLAPVTGLRQGDVAHVELEVEVGVVRPSRGGRGRAAPERASPGTTARAARAR